VVTARLPPQITGIPFQSAAMDPSILTGYFGISGQELLSALPDKSTIEKSSDLLDNPSPIKSNPKGVFLSECLVA
jgi:hypothetical protein